MSDWLDRYAARPSVCRKIFDGPHPDARWDKYEELWIETDESLRRRIKEALKETP